MVSLILPKNERNTLRIVVFWKNPGHHNLLLRFTDLYQNSKPQSNLMVRPFLTRKRLSLHLTLIWQTKIELLNFSLSYSLPCTLLVLRIFVHFNQSGTLLWVKWKNPENWQCAMVTFPKLLLIIFIESVDRLPTKYHCPPKGGKTTTPIISL